MCRQQAVRQAADLQWAVVQVARAGSIAAIAVLLQVADVPGLHRCIVKAESLPTVRQALCWPHLLQQQDNLDNSMAEAASVRHALG